jgi:Icc-related predicted phosphoesterase
MHVQLASQRSVRIITISDTHNRHHELEKHGLMTPADILIHCGDFTDHGTLEETNEFNEFLGRMRKMYKYVVVIPGNHDKVLDPRVTHKYTSKTAREILSNATHYLVNESAIIEGIKFYGMPINNRCKGAFGTQNEDESEKYYKMIPTDTDVLLTHTPAFNILDLAWDTSQKSVEVCKHCGESHVDFRHWGCYKLTEYVLNLKPKVHICGHVHDARGTTAINGITFINAGNTCGKMLYKPISFDFVVNI